MPRCYNMVYFKSIFNNTSASSSIFRIDKFVSDRYFDMTQPRKIIEIMEDLLTLHRLFIHIYLLHKLLSRSCYTSTTPWRAFSAHINAMILESSALCSNCSLLIWSSASLAAISWPVISMRFCRDSILASKLSKNGAENLTPLAFAFGNLISSLRGALRPLNCGSWSTDLGLSTY